MEDRDIPLGEAVGKAIIISAASTAATMVTMVAAGYVISKVKAHINRKDEKVEEK